MNMISAEQDNMDMLLTQLGAKVQSIHGLLCYVRFSINGTEVFYVYNINAKEQFYLQKVLPYPVGAGVFTKPSEVVEYIKNDIKLYKNASNSSVFSDFINTNLVLHRMVHNLETTFLNYNIPAEAMKGVLTELEHLNKTLDNLKDTCDEIIVK